MLVPDRGCPRLPINQPAHLGHHESNTTAQKTENKCLCVSAQILYTTVKLVAVTEINTFHCTAFHGSYSHAQWHCVALHAARKFLIEPAVNLL